MPVGRGLEGELSEEEEWEEKRLTSGSEYEETPVELRTCVVLEGRGRGRRK